VTQKGNKSEGTKVGESMTKHPRPKINLSAFWVGVSVGKTVVSTISVAAIASMPSCSSIAVSWRTPAIAWETQNTTTTNTTTTTIINTTTIIEERTSSDERSTIIVIVIIVVVIVLIIIVAIILIVIIILMYY
jgi:hypothetical protein